MIERRLEICALGSVVAHLVLATSLGTLPHAVDASMPTSIAVRIIEPPRAPPPPEPEPEPQPETIHEAPRPEPARVRKQTLREPEHPTSERPTLTPDDQAIPHFGITMESTSQAGLGPAMPVGNVAHPTRDARDSTHALAQAVTPAAEVTKMPLPRGRCAGKYTDAARAAAIEGVVVLDLTVDEQGRARDIHIAQGLSHGLTEAAIDALAQCSFDPGEKQGRPVPVRVRGFKIRFVMPEAR